VKVVDYVDWSSEEEEEEEEKEEAPKSRNDRKKGRVAADEESAWALRLVVIDDEERRYELTGEPFDAPLPPPIKAAKDRQAEGPANEEKGGTEAPEAATNGDGTTEKDAKKSKKETFYAAMKEIEGGQNVGLLEGWWFCLRASNDDFTHALALGGKKKLTKFPTEGLISCFLSYGPPNVPPKHRTVRPHPQKTRGEPKFAWRRTHARPLADNNALHRSPIRWRTSATMCSSHTSLPSRRRSGRRPERYEASALPHVSAV
jgi:hypothetical protein